MAKFNHTAHKELWDWLAKNPDKNKYDWPGWGFNGGKHVATRGCFACKYVVYRYGWDKKDDCENCPLVWPNDIYCDENSDESLYGAWRNETDLKKRSELARQIRDLPVWEGVECE